VTEPAGLPSDGSQGKAVTGVAFLMGSKGDFERGTSTVSHGSAHSAGRQEDRGWSRAIGLDVEPGRFFEGANVLWRIAPFVAAGLLPFALVPIAGLSYADPRVAIAAAMVPLIVGSALLVPWERFAAWPQAIPPLAYFVVLALLRDAGGGSLTIFDPLLSIPITWFAIYGTGRELALSIAAMGLTLLLPALLPGHSAYDSEQLQRMVVAVVLAGAVGPAVHALVLALRRTSKDLGEAEERFRKAFDDSRVGMSLVTTGGRYLRVNRALCEITGYPEDELLGKTFGEITHPDDVDTDLDALRDLIDGERYGYRTEKRYLHAEGHPVWVSLNVSPIYDSDGAVSYLLSQVEDISDRKESEERLTRQALHDSLTGLPNRTLFADRVRMASSRRGAHGYAIVYLDLDGFKLVNDTLGHAAGDQVLIEVARRLERLLRSGDTLARLSGDEFALLCEGVGEREVRTIADRVIDAMAEPIDVQGRAITQAASIGIALYSADGSPTEPDQMLGDADLAMYRAKAAGKSRYALFESWMRTGDTDQTGLERELRAGISNDELTVYYQPEVDLISGEITGAEALVRWQHPDRGLLEPAQFLFAAESTDLISELDDLVMRTACLQAARWREEIPDGERFTVSVNISERRLADPGLSAKIGQAIADAQLPAASICLEIAERAVMDRRASALSAIPDLEALGIRLLIDDFGIAISSFGSLKRLPRLNAIKIDASFIAGLGRSREDSAGVAAIVGLAHGLDLTATAEGLEREEQLRELQALHCDHGQGYYFARPQPPEALGELLNSARLGELIS
jgi:diguanylate cyclase (GGDEF)-like protein/PAS domain S-box-containing protein